VGLVNGDSYYYQVSAVNAIGEGPITPEVSVTPIQPDTTRPNVTISSPPNGAAVQSVTVTVMGTALDNIAVEKVEVSVDGMTWVTASGTTSWSATLTLRQGSNTITARATDTSGNVATTTVTVTTEVPMPAPEGLPLLFLSFLAGGAILVAALLVLFYLLRRRKRGGAQPPPGMTPPAQ